jgi:hypothetical protein
VFPLHEPAPGTNGKIPPGPVWQCSLRNDATDRTLSDDEWRDIGWDLLHRTGIAPRGDLGACRWAMVRHADDHIHIAAVLVREDTRKKFFPRNDYLRARETCLAAEQTYGLVQTAPIDRTALPAATHAETEKATRRGMGEPSRVWLRRAVRTAAVQSHTPDTFLARLREHGILVRPRHDPHGHLIGYAVAQPGDINPDGTPVWYAGRTLARDLSLPQLAQRWQSAPAPPEQLPPEPTEHASVGRVERAAALANATVAADQAAQTLAAGLGDGGGIAHAAGDVLTALAQVIPDTPVSAALREQLAGVAEVYDRAARTPPHRPTGGLGQRGAGVTHRGLATRRGPDPVSARLRGRRHGHAAGRIGCVGRGSRRLPSGPRQACPSPRRATSAQRAGGVPIPGHSSCSRSDSGTTRRATWGAPAPGTGSRHPRPPRCHHQRANVGAAAGTPPWAGCGPGA